jgi:hypothetical protein
MLHFYETTTSALISTPITDHHTPSFLAIWKLLSHSLLYKISEISEEQEIGYLVAC